jgi:hypothetical protein
MRRLLGEGVVSVHYYNMIRGEGQSSHLLPLASLGIHFRHASSHHCREHTLVRSNMSPTRLSTKVQAPTWSKATPRHWKFVRLTA